MNVVTQNQIQEILSVTVNPHEAATTKHCTSCETELLVSKNINYTRFGLHLCEDCLYS